MAAKTTGYSDNLLALVFQGQTFSGIARNDAAPLTNLYVSLHTNTLNASSTQATSEAAYPSYSRTAVTRTSGGWTVTNNTVSPAALITFPASTGSPSETEVAFGVGLSASGAGSLLYFGTISPNIAITTAGIVPELTTSSMITEV